MDIISYFRSASKPSVVSSSGDSENGNRSEIDVQPILLRSIAQVLLLNHQPPTKSGYGIRINNKKCEETFLWLEFDENLQGAL